MRMKNVTNVIFVRNVGARRESTAACAANMTKTYVTIVIHAATVRRVKVFIVTTAVDASQIFRYVISMSQK